MFKKTILAGAVAAALGSGLAQAQDKPAEPASPHTLTGNVGFYSQYIFRGLTQTNRDPAIQGGFDYSHSSGLYAGTWASNISWLRDGGAYSAGGSMEWDFYGGWKWGFAPDWTLDLGGLYYWYPGDNNPFCFYGAVNCPKADTFEIYAGISWKWLSAKASYVVSNKAFGLPEADGTYYIDLGVSVPLGDFAKELTGVTVFGHYGWQQYRGQIPGLGISNSDLASYRDWKIGVSYALPKDFTIGAFYTDTSRANSLFYGSPSDSPAGPYPRNIAKGTGTVYIQKTF
jgi:uncharacterized protein (TIGR02001 family)